MASDFKKINIRDKTKTIEVLTELVRKKESLSGSFVEKQISKVLGGNVSDAQMALDILSEQLYKERTEKVDQKISIISRNLTNNPEEKEKIKNEAEKMILEGKGSSLVEADLNIQIAAEKMRVELDRWIKNNPKEVKNYRAEKFKKDFIEKTKRRNFGLTKDQENYIRQKAELVAGVYFSENQIHPDEKKMFFETNKNENSAKLRNSWTDLQGIVGFLGMSPKKTDNLLKKNEQINSNLKDIEIPYEQFSNVRSFDNLADIFKNQGTGLLSSAQNRFGVLNRSVQTISRFTGGWWEKGATKIVNGFVSKIGNQAVASFIKNSTSLLLQNGLRGSLGAILKGVASGGVKAMAGAAAGVATGPIGWILTGLSLIKNALKKMFGGLGFDAKNFLGDAFGKAGGGLVALATGLVIIPTLAIASIALVLNPAVLIGLGLGTGFLTKQQYDLASSLVPDINKKSIDGLVLRGPAKCDVSDKTVAINQCSEENKKIRISEDSCPYTTETNREKTICTSGCGLVSTAIILQAHESMNTPECLLNSEMGCKSALFGEASCSIGWSGIRKTLEMNLGDSAINYDLDTDGTRDGSWVPAVDFNTSKEKISEAICDDNIVIILVSHIGEDGNETGGRHYLVATAVLENGDIAFKDPNFSDTEFNYWSDYMYHSDGTIKERPLRVMAIRADTI